MKWGCRLMRSSRVLKGCSVRGDDESLHTCRGWKEVGVSKILVAGRNELGGWLKRLDGDCSWHRWCFSSGIW